MDEYWKQEFGYGIDRLTQGEAGHLKAAQSVDAIRDRITAARVKARSEENAKTASPSQSPERSRAGVRTQAEAEIWPRRRRLWLRLQKLKNATILFFRTTLKPKPGSSPGDDTKLSYRLVAPETPFTD